MAYVKGDDNNVLCDKTTTLSPLMRAMLLDSKIIDDIFKIHIITPNPNINKGQAHI